jgi:hypothetical protein
MKKVKLIIFLAAAIALITSCTDNNVSPASSDLTLSASQVPTVVQSALTTSYPTATNTTWSKVSPSVYQASFQASAKSMVASINSTGRLLYSHGLIDPATLPAAIISYLNTNYAGYVIKKAGSRTDSTGAVQGYMVEFTLNSLTYEIRFDASGSFLSLEMEDGSRECTEIAQADLPAAITTYLNSNYSGYTFNHARANKTNGTISGYGVEITYNGTKVRLLFDAAGAFLGLDTKDGKGHGQDSLRGGGKGHGKDGKGRGLPPTPVAQADLLAAITTYLNTNYPGYSFVEAASFSDGSKIIKYEVKITYQSKAYELEFDSAGAFVKVH